MQIDRSKRPVGSEEIEFTPPAIKNFALTNGLKVFLSEKKELPIVRINVLVNSGSRFDPKNEKGLCNLLTMCLDEGAGEFTALQLADEFEMLGAQFSASCNEDVSIISLQVLSENFIPALKLINDVITNPHLGEQDFNREKNKILVRLNQAKTEPDYIADISYEYFLFGKDSPYAFPVTGVEETIQKIQIGSIRNVYKNHFSPQNSKMVVVGNVDQDLLQNELQKILGGWNNSSTAKTFQFDPYKNQKKIYLINKSDSVQTEIRVGHLSSKRNTEDFFQKQIVNLVLGGQFSSRLNLNLREKNGYTYGIHSQFNYLKYAGNFAVSTSVDVANTANALNEIHKEINAIKLGITAEELNFAKSTLTKKYPSNFETYRQVAANITNKVIYNLPDDYFEAYIEKVRSISLNDVNEIANNSIYPDDLISVLVGDSKKITSQMDENKFGEIIVLEFNEVFQM